MQFDRDQFGADLGDIKAIEIGGIVPETGQSSNEVTIGTDKIVDVESHESIGERIASGFGKAKNIITELLGPVEADKLIESVPDEAALEVKVNIGYRATKRKFGKEFMGNLASGLRNIPDGELRIRGKDGEIKGDDARLSSVMNIKKLSDASSLLDIEDAAEQLLEVHRRFLHDGKIEAD